MFFEGEGTIEVNNKNYFVHKLTKPISKEIKIHYQRGFFITENHTVLAVGGFVARDERVEARVTPPDKKEWFYGYSIEEAFEKLLLSRE